MAHDNDADRAAAAALASLPKMGPRRLEALVRRHGYVGAWGCVQAGEAAQGRGMQAVLGVQADDIVNEWRQASALLDPIEVLERHRTAGIEIIPLGSDRYPAVLAADHERPMVLFARGDLGRMGPPRVALVGTRRATSGGRRTARSWGRALSEMGIQVVSGLALGIDGSSHLGALEALDAGGAGVAPPLGVVGTGLDVVYPRRHADLWERVAEDGLLLSEVPAGGGPNRWRFPARNRIIAALADVLVVIESHASGGALSTAEEALDRDRAVLAVPGSLHTPAASGSNKLLVDGAVPACEIADIVGQLALSSCDRLVDVTPPPPAPDHVAPSDESSPLDDVDRALLDRIGWEPVSLERVAVDSGLSVGELSLRLLSLEGEGRIIRRGGAIEQVDRP